MVKFVYGFHTLNDNSCNIQVKSKIYLMNGRKSECTFLKMFYMIQITYALDFWNMVFYTTRCSANVIILFCLTYVNARTEKRLDILLSHIAAKEIVKDNFLLSNVII